MEGFLSTEEIAFLLTYIEETSLFGVIQKEDEAYAMEQLIKKGWIEKGLKPNKQTMMLVEMLRLYQQAKLYLHFQEYVFGLVEGERWIIKKEVEEEEKTYQAFFMGNQASVAKIMQGHPLIYYSLAPTDERPLPDCNLILEMFDEHKAFIAELLIEAKEGIPYLLSDALKRETAVEKRDIQKWLMKHFPIGLKGELEQWQN